MSNNQLVPFQQISEQLSSSSYPTTYVINNGHMNVEYDPNRNIGIYNAPGGTLNIISPGTNISGGPVYNASSVSATPEIHHHNDVHLPPFPRIKTPKDRPYPLPLPPYELIYWPTLPGRGEFIRLALEATGTPYTDISNLPSGPGAAAVLAQIKPDNLGTDANPPPLAPPILRHGDLVISQTSNILMYLAPRLGLAGEDDGDGEGVAKYRINQLALTALDGFCDEAHETHHPVATGSFYEDQRDEAVKRAKDYREARLPKFLGYFERVLKAQEEKGIGEGGWLYGKGMTWADLVVWQGVDGVGFAFPKRMAALREGGSLGEFLGCVRG
ncbi:MAG: hypothetical protein OHK93_003907 [Ramalina farinacea]|uniref:Glutathione S-transferase n=1 Tax=Ramalina farinacea TaxID=258253 RepID=A0AA43TRK5_9LECA|nr:hypothetical protein [Ramalina farinacea]